MNDLKKEILKRMREKAIKHKLRTLEKEITYAYREGNFKEVQKLSKMIIDLRNEQIDNMTSELDQKLTNSEKQLDEAFNRIEDLNQDLGLNLKPNEQEYIKFIMKNKPIKDEEDREAEKLLEEIMRQNGK